MEYVPGTQIKKPDCELVGQNGNAFAVIGRAIRSLKQAKVPEDIIREYQKKAMSGDYNHLLATTMEYVNEAGEDDETEDEDWDDEED